MAKSNIAPAIGPDRGRRIVGRRHETLPTRLTPEELWDESAAACAKIVEYALEEEIKKAAAKAAGVKLKLLRKEAEQHARHVKMGQLDREVEIIEVYDLVEDVVHTVRGDNGEPIMRPRKPTDAERQETFEFGAVQ